MQRLQMRVEIQEVVHLDEIEPRTLQQLCRVRHLLDPGTRAACPHFGGEERPPVHVRRHELSQHRFRAAVHRRGIDQARAGGEEPLQHFLERGALGGGLADFEGARGAQADQRQLFAARGDLAQERRIARVRGAGP